jgi:hypothetical protein
MNIKSLGMAMAHALNLLPVWMAVAWSAAFALIAVSHLRHMTQTSGQQRPWHACHVLMAAGMAFMYLPARLDPVTLPSAFWKLVFAGAGLIAALWALAGNGRVSTLIWLLSSVDLGAMLYMWSGSPRHPGTAPLAWLLTAYLLVASMMWALDLYRRFDGSTPIVSWRVLASESGVTLSAGAGRTAGVGTGSLLGELDISASMIVMAIGMAYMLVATQLMA